jgi:hypothetical protein
MLKRFLQPRPEPTTTERLARDEEALVEALEETGDALERLLAQRHRLARHLYSPTVPLERLTGKTAVSLVADETVLREALRRVRAIVGAVAGEAYDRPRPRLVHIA